jgi:hypothetical protein
MKNIYFFVSSFYAGRQTKMVKRLVSSLKNNYGQKVGAAFLEDTDEQSLTADASISKVREKLEKMLEKEHIVFAGIGINLNIFSLHEEFPEAKIFMFKRTNIGLEKNDKLLTIKSDNYEWAKDYNLRVREEMERLVSNKSLSWKTINRPIFLENAFPNFTPDDQEPTTETLISVINIK